MLHGRMQGNIQLNTLATLVTKVVRLKAALSLAQESRKKEQSKQDPLQLPDFAIVKADHAEIICNSSKILGKFIFLI